MKEHQYTTTVQWTGNRGEGTSHYRAYDRSHTISCDGKPDIAGSADAAFRGDKSKYNPEDLLITSLSSCHMLWYLHLCAEAGVVVVDYVDHATGVMSVAPEGHGNFTEVILNPVVTVTHPDMVEKANAIHKEANRFCFIANSVNFPVHHRPTCQTTGQ